MFLECSLLLTQQNMDLGKSPKDPGGPVVSLESLRLPQWGMSNLPRPKFRRMTYHLRYPAISNPLNVLQAHYRGSCRYPSSADECIIEYPTLEGLNQAEDTIAHFSLCRGDLHKDKRKPHSLF